MIQPLGGRRWPSTALLFLITLCACQHPISHPHPSRTAVQVLGFTIQAGAFARVENAAKLSNRLREQGLEATYFAAGKGLFKVRFGDFSSREAARNRAEIFKNSGSIDSFFIVAPDTQAAAQRPVTGDAPLREELVRTARSYMCMPYLWG